MREKIENYIKLENEIKHHCYNLSNKWSNYRKSLNPVVKDWECSIYDFTNKNISNLDFEFDEFLFRIGFEKYSRCGDSSFYSSFKIDEIVNEKLIKQKIDNIYEKKKRELQEIDLIKKQKKEISKKREFELYQKLKNKFENED